MISVIRNLVETGEVIYKTGPATSRLPGYSFYDDGRVEEFSNPYLGIASHPWLERNLHGFKIQINPHELSDREIIDELIKTSGREVYDTATRKEITRAYQDRMNEFRCFFSIFVRSPIAVPLRTFLGIADRNKWWNRLAEPPYIFRDIPKLSKQNTLLIRTPEGERYIVSSGEDRRTSIQTRTLCDERLSNVSLSGMKELVRGISDLLIPFWTIEEDISEDQGKQRIKELTE